MPKKEDRLKVIFIVATVLLFGAISVLGTTLVLYLLKPDVFSPTSFMSLIIISLCWVIAMSGAFFSAVKMARDYSRRSRDEGLNIIQTLAGNFTSVFSADIKTGAVTFLRVHDSIERALEHKKGAKEDYDKLVSSYAERFVLPKWKNDFLEEMDRENIASKLKERNYYSFIFKAKNGDDEKFLQMKAVKAAKDSSTYVIGFADVDSDFRADEEKKRIMQEALETAEKANKAKSIFLTNMSHDIRTPLNAIVGFATIAQWHTNDAKKMSEYIGKIISAANQMNILVNNVLDMSSFEGGENEISKVPANLKAIVQDVETVIRAEALEKNQTLMINYVAFKNECVLCDTVRLNRILMNLLGNAVRFTDKHGVISLTVTQTAATDKTADYVFSVKDTGIGIGDEFAPHIYEMFSRERSSTESGIPGLGLGMSIIKKNVDLMNGKIEFASEKGSGTEFTVKLRFDLTDEVIVFEQIVDTDREPQVLKPENSKTVIIAEDNSMSNDILYNILTESGYRVERAYTGKEAVDVFEASSEGSVNLILMDIQMPEMDGLTATEIIRKLDRADAATVPIVAVTANAFSQDAAAARQVGMNEHITKPVKVPKLNEVLKRYLG